MKTIFAFIIFLISLFSPSHPLEGQKVQPATQAAPPEYAELLEKYVTANGVKYAAWHSNSADLQKLDQVVQFYATTTPPDGEDASLAWHLNAYNAWVLHNILDKYPTKGPLDGETLFFHGKRIVISGKKVSFDHLEQDVIRPNFRDARIHFALNCAAESCPPLHDEPFRGETLDATLNSLTREFINNNPQGVVAKNGTVRLSKIFEWYKEDFGGKEKLLQYVNYYRDDNVDPESKVEFLDYSWKLNAAG